MPWEEETVMTLRKEFVSKAREENVNFSELCRAYGISRKNGYKWLKRYKQEGEPGLTDRSRRPQHSPNQTRPEIEQVILEWREKQPVWGARKLKRRLEELGHEGLPSVSTITQILQRNGCIDEEESVKHRAYQRFEKEQSNELWQMDFKGYFRMENQHDCHPLTVLDDHSRFLVGLKACPNETHQTVQSHLTCIFREYGLPEGMLMDNGSPWGDDSETRFTTFTAWLLRLGIKVSHARPYHPQTQGKDERLHRTLKSELLSRTVIYSLSDSQQQFDRWRYIYNFERPHDALDLETPATRFRPSRRPFPEKLPPLIYPDADAVRKVDGSGKISLKGKSFRVGKAFCGQPIGLRFDELTDGLVHVFYCDTQIRTLNLLDV